MKKVFAVIAFAFILSSCEDEWGHTTTMGWVSEIVDDGSGSCTYYFSYKADSKAKDQKVIGACGTWKVGEGIWLDVNNK